MKFSYIKRKIDISKYMLSWKMKLSGLRRYNYVNDTKLVNLISVSILNIFLKKGNCKKKQCANL